MISYVQIAKGLRRRFSQVQIVKNLCRSNWMSLLRDAERWTAPAAKASHAANGKQPQIVGTALVGLDEFQDIAPPIETNLTAAVLCLVCCCHVARSAHFFRCRKPDLNSALRESQPKIPAKLGDVLIQLGRQARAGGVLIRTTV